MISRLSITVLAVLLLLSSFSQAIDLTGHNDPGLDQTIFKIDSNSTKKDIFSFFETLKESFEIEAELISYKTRNGKLMVLGIAFQEESNRATNLLIKSEDEIDELCIVINNVTRIVSYAGSCEQEGQSLLRRDSDYEIKENKILTARTEKLVEYKKRIKAVFEKEDITVERDIKADSQKQAAENARKNSRRNLTKTEGAYSSVSQAVNREYNKRKDSLKKVREEKLGLDKLKNKEIALQTKRRKDSLKKARLIGRKARLAIKDSVKKPVYTMVTKEPLVNNSSIPQSNSGIVLKTPKAIITEDQQNTNDAIAAIKREQAINNVANNNRTGETLFFSGESFTYKVYGNRTFVYDSNNQTLLKINAPLSSNPAIGKTVLKGVTYDFEFDGIALVLKNKDGFLINKEGDLLNPIASFDNDKNSFKITKEYVITSQSTAIGIRTVIKEFEKLGFTFTILENVSNPSGRINYFAFKINEKTYSFKELKGIPVLLIQIDELNKKSRVQTAN